MKKSGSLFKRLFVPEFESKTAAMLYIPTMICASTAMFIAGFPMICTVYCIVETVTILGTEFGLVEPS